MQIENATRGTVVASSARAARSAWSRMVGLLGRGSLQPGEALLIEPCSSVHTAFMRFAIDVLYIDKANRVIKAVPDLKPFRMSATSRAHAVIELPPGTIDNSHTSIGDELTFFD